MTTYTFSSMFTRYTSDFTALDSFSTKTNLVLDSPIPEISYSIVGELPKGQQDSVFAPSFPFANVMVEDVGVLDVIDTFTSEFKFSGDPYVLFEFVGEFEDGNYVLSVVVGSGGEAFDDIDGLDDFNALDSFITERGKASSDFFAELTPLDIEDWDWTSKSQNDEFVGGSGVDTFNGGSGMDTIFGGDGADTINGGSGNDFLIDGSGDDVVLGGSGDDTIENLGGTDSFNGGRGNDLLITDVSEFDPDFTVLFDAKAGAHGRLEDSPFPNDTISKIESFQLIGAWNSLIIGDGKANTLSGDEGRDTISGGGGDDLIIGGGEADQLSGGRGSDIIDGGSGSNELRGGRGVDSYVHNGLNGGTDTISDSNGANILTVIDTPGRDSGSFINQGDSLLWRPFDRSSSVVIEGDGMGNFDVATLNWQRLEDLDLDITPYSLNLDIITAPEQIRDGSDFALALTDMGDVVSIRDIPELGGNYSEIYLNGGDDVLKVENVGGAYLIGYGGDGEDRMEGLGNYFEHFLGDAGADKLIGRGGDDVLYGGAGKDRVFGGRGSDEISGGEGKDRLSGGAGKDTFVYYSDINEGRDIILDFDIAKDSIDLFDEAGSPSIRALNSGTDSLLVLDSGTRIVLRDVTVEQADGIDFV